MTIIDEIYAELEEMKKRGIKREENIRYELDLKLDALKRKEFEELENIFKKLQNTIKGE